MKFQSPRGTRDFYPKEMAWENYLIAAWRRVSIRNGFEEVNGPIFESLDLYKVKSGEGIVAELFHFEDRGERELAIRPEFTPTLARMVAAQANSLPRPIKWFCIPNLCRAERPQRGRLREFLQWNIDIIGHEPTKAPLADAECILTAVDLLQELKLTPQHVRVKISHRQTVRHVLTKLGVPAEKLLEAFDLLDRRDKLPPELFAAGAAKLGLDESKVHRFDQTCRMKYRAGNLGPMRDQIGIGDELEQLEALDAQLRGFDIAEWCEYDLGVVRGLAYYTGTVFEVHEVSGALRAMAGGGRYDQLIELFGGPSLPGVGLGMGDVVLSEVLIDKGLMPQDVTPRPDVFVVSLTDGADGRLPGVVAGLRKAGLHARFSYKATRNLGKLLKDADSARARYVAILDDKLGQGVVTVKNLSSGEQAEVKVGDLAGRVKNV